MSGAQNVSASPVDQATQKIFELLIGALIARFALDVALDSPDSGKASTNPDVLCTFEGVRWGVACKTIHGDAPRTFADRICEGADQIARSEATRGIVLLNLFNVLPYDRLGPHTNAAGERVSVVFRDAREALAITREFNKARLDAADAAMGSEGWAARLYNDSNNARAPKITVALVLYTEISIHVIPPDERPAWQQVTDIGRTPIAPPEIDEAGHKFIDALLGAIRGE